VQRTAQQKNIHQKKRYGYHQKRSKRFGSTYFPYLPMILILFVSVILSGYTPRRGTLAYATEMSQQSLLNATNSERTNNGKTTLKLNSTLSQAAQAKANDMTARNYWSHKTPEGQDPWVFFNKVGYSYLKAGENLAYGFTTSRDTVTGWMNSPSHRDNLLDPDFSEVGFGYANSSNYNKAGQETVVVAMYGNPQKTTPSQQQSPQTLAGPETPNPTINQPVTANTTRPITRVETITGGKAPWAMTAIGFLAGTMVMFLMLRYGFRIKKLIGDSENFILHHPLIDGTLVALVVLCLVLSRTVGFIH
jgi:uncharacterized protein YkwD